MQNLKRPHPGRFVKLLSGVEGGNAAWLGCFGGGCGERELHGGGGALRGLLEELQDAGVVIDGEVSVEQGVGTAAA